MKINEESNEIAKIAVILGDHYADKVYKILDFYIPTVDEITRWAIDFYTQTAHIKNWEPYNKTNILPIVIDDSVVLLNACDWDNFIIKYGELKLKTFNKDMNG